MSTRTYLSYISNPSSPHSGMCAYFILSLGCTSICLCRPQAHKSPSDQPADQIDSVHTRRRDIPVLLLLAMFACASRHDSITTPLPADPSIMWPAGDEYLERAKFVLNSTYASSRPATVQALLLMGYREGGIGDMCLAWTYVGMAIRMAQDLGMHRLADGWKRSDLGGRLFGEWELSERKRIWFGCVVLDKFISAIIGVFMWSLPLKCCHSWMVQVVHS
jgi:hypothetical protein